jgi:hypothetical protein
MQIHSIHHYVALIFSQVRLSTFELFQKQNLITPNVLVADVSILMPLIFIFAAFQI